MSVSEPAPRNRAWAPGILLIFATLLISGVSNFVNFRAVQGTNVDAWIAVRNTAVALLLVPLALALPSGVRARLRGADWLRLSVIGVIGGGIPFLLYFHGFQLAFSQGGAASASLGYRSLFLMASALSVVVLREKLSRKFLVGAGLLFVGNVLLLSLTGPLWTDGTGYVLLATGLWAAEYAVSKRTLRDLPSSVVALGRMGFGAVFLLAYLGLTGQASAVATFGGADWMNLFLSGLLLLGFVTTWYAGLKTVDLSVASGLLVLAFPITWALGIAFSGGGFTLEQGLGALAIAAGTGILASIAVVRRGGEAIVHRVRMRLSGVR